ncbi:ABC transporter ATP-binding protein [candidate division KSB1 bacterium]
MDQCEIQNVSMVYTVGHIKVEALRNLDLKIGKGDFVSVAGPSGSGKTTLLNLIGCLDKPTEGIVKIAGKDTSHMSSAMLADLRSEKIGFIFQSYNLIPVLTAFENIEFPLILQKKYNSLRRKEMVESMLDDVDILDLRDRKPKEMSGGQQQRVAIARSLVKKPELVLADEPTANLDSATGGNVLEIMKEMNEKLNVTFIFSTHDNMVMNFARRLVKLKDGRISSDETRDKG